MSKGSEWREAAMPEDQEAPEWDEMDDPQMCRRCGTTHPEASVDPARIARALRVLEIVEQWASKHGLSEVPEDDTCREILRLTEESMKEEKP